MHTQHVQERATAQFYGRVPQHPKRDQSSVSENLTSRIHARFNNRAGKIHVRQDTRSETKSPSRFCGSCHKTRYFPFSVRQEARARGVQRELPSSGLSSRTLSRDVLPRGNLRSLLHVLDAARATLSSDATLLKELRTRCG